MKNTQNIDRDFAHSKDCSVATVMEMSISGPPPIRSRESKDNFLESTPESEPAALIPR